MYKVTVKHTVEIEVEPAVEATDKEPAVEAKTVIDMAALTLKTDNRNLARAVYELCGENEIECEVVVEAVPKPVKFKGLD